MIYALVLGNTPNLSIKEAEIILKSLYSTFNLKVLQENILQLETEQEVNAENLLKILGGTVKIARFCCNTKSLEDVDKIASCLSQNHQKVDFGVSVYGSEEDIKKISQKIKENLKEKSIPSRFLLPKDQEISSVVFEKQKIQELLLVKNGNEYSIFSTLAVQNFEDWGFRDYKRPCVDPKRGMLPPKVARMMINLAAESMTSGKTLLDPFCGVGTILSEALIRGYDVVGVDQSKEAISCTQKNLEWIKDSYRLSQKFTLYEHDSTHLSEVIKADSLDCVVTEPYMGPMVTKVREKTFLGNKDATPETIGNIIKGLEKLYIGCLKDWGKLLRQGSKVIMAFPSYHLGNLEFRVNSPIDKIGELSYTFCQGPIIYSRPQAIVKRNIYIFKKV